MKKLLILAILGISMITGSSLFAEPITTSGKISYLCSYSSLSEDIYVVIETGSGQTQGYWINKTIDGYKNIYAFLLAANMTNSTVEIMGESEASWKFDHKVYEHVYRIWRVRKIN